MDACSDPTIQEVVVMAGAQLGKSEAILNILGYHIDNDPSPILLLQPTVEMAQAFSKDRVAAGLLASTPCLKGKVKDPRSRDSGNTTLHKVFPGGALTLVGANSPAGLASRPVRIVLCDEVDRFPVSAGSEGDPIQLARKRTATFWNRKVIMVSTPTNKGASRIEDAYLKSDQRQYYVPCKHCHHDQVLKWSHVSWDEGKPETARYTCPECGVAWSESDRTWSIRNGQWVASEPFTGVAGFAINGLYSPWTPLGDAAKEFWSVRKSPEQLRVWCNTYLGETWEDQGETLDEHNLIERREPMPFIPAEARLLLAGVDVQDNRLEVSVIGMGKDERMFVFKHDTLYGDPSSPQLWEALDSVLFKTYETEDGLDITISAACVDSGGHFTNQVYAYCKRNTGKRVFAIKGVGGEGKPIAGRPSKNNIAKCPLFPLGVNTTKELIFARLRIEEDIPGFIRFSDELDEEYFKQLTAEKVVTRYYKGFPRREFVKQRSRNEAIDTMVYAYSAYAIMGVNVNTFVDRFDKKAQVEEQKKPEKVVKKQPFVPRQGRNFVNSWR